MLISMIFSLVKHFPWVIIPTLAIVVTCDGVATGDHDVNDGVVIGDDVVNGDDVANGDVVAMSDNDATGDDAFNMVGKVFCVMHVSMVPSYLISF